MDFRDSTDEAAFREEAVGWLERTLPRLPEDDPADQAARERNARWWQEALCDGGWAGITWPVEYGGRGLGVVHQAIFNEEAARRGAPTPLNFLGMILGGPTILVHGTEEQKARLLPPILSGEEVWCQGFSEPGAGSDLAGLRAHALPTDGGFAVTGQKVWTSFAHVAQRCMLLARTSDPGEDGRPHGGITYFAARMDEVETRPLTMINGDADFNEMFLEDVFVAAEDVVGGIGDGWAVALTTLSFERGSLAFSLQVRARRALDRLVRRVVALHLDHDDEGFLHRLATFHIEAEALRIGAIRTMSAVSAGGAPGPEASGLKLTWGHLMQELTRLGVEIGDEVGLAVDDPEAGFWASAYLRARGNSIEGGTDEIQRSIIAERVLGLPRSR